MAIRIHALAVSIPGLRAFRWSSDGPYTAMKESYAIGLVERGRTVYLHGGREYRCGPGSLHLKQPGDVHRDVARDGPVDIQVVSFPATVVESVFGLPGPRRVEAQLEPNDPRGAPFRRLHAAVRAGDGRLALEVAVTEAIAAIGEVRDRRSAHTRAVRHTLDLLRSRFTETVTLDDLAAHAGVDKFRLCRAFRAEVGMPPHTYLTHLRVVRAKALLAAGAPPREVAAEVGFYDQSQLHRHFRRIVGTTPGRFARSA